MSRVQQFLRTRGSSPGHSPSLAQDAHAEHEATQEGVRSTLQGKDFSQVRVHADAEAAGHAEALGARAFASGGDIYFGAGEFAPRTPAGLQLLAHELGHVNQQAQHGGGSLQFQPKDEKKAGIGAAPPEEDFIKDPDNWGAEDSDVLFEKDQAAVGGGDEKALSDFAAKQKEPVNVHVHGYSSQEGPAEYNLNLSAQRGVAVKHLLESLLPAGSKVFVFAHGESRHFGAAANNRRAGISLIGPVAGGGFHLRLDPDLQLKFGRAPDSWKPPVFVPVPGFKPDLFSGTGSTSGPSPLITAPPPLGAPRSLMDNAALLAPSAGHGASPSAAGSVVEQWDAAYLKYHSLGIPDQFKLGPIDLGAAELANKEVKNSIQAYYERNDPTVIEKSNAEVGAHIVTSPNLLDLFSKKKKVNKDSK
jgi:outer membrane protein OmpA-like peptidoglycan-associated protein